MQNVLVTGGAGFIGSHVVDRFRAAGTSVAVIDDLSAGKAENLPRDVVLHVADIGSDAAAKVIRDGNFDVIAHLAAQVDVRKSVSAPAVDAQTNILGTLNILETVRDLPKEKRPRVIFASTAGLYGDAAELPTPESAPTDPGAPYGVAKLAVEHYMGYYAKVWGIETIVLRFANVYGPRQDPHGEAGVVAIFAGKVLAGDPLTVCGSGEQTRDYIFVSDVADAFFAGATCDLPDAGPITARAFNIGSGVETSVIELARLLSKVAGVEESVTFIPSRPGEVIRSLLDPRKAAGALGWRASVPIETGLARTLDWARTSSQPTR